MNASAFIAFYFTFGVFIMGPYIIIFLLCLAATLLLVFFLKYQNNNIVISEYAFDSPILPKEWDGKKILQISDLHNHLFGKCQSLLIDKIHATSPDFIFISGDLIDKRRTDYNDIDIALTLIRQIVNIAPVIFSPGNHEHISPCYAYLREKLIEYGVIVLDNKLIYLYSKSEKIAVSGVEDISFLGEPDTDAHKDEFKEILKSVKCRDESFNILISHRPDLIDIYSESGYDLVFSGHAHGGQFRFPLIGGIYSPHQGLFPKYTSGFYRNGSTVMLVSRGLGNSRFPFRLFNFPELNILTFSKK